MAFGSSVPGDGRKAGRRPSVEMPDQGGSGHDVSPSVGRADEVTNENHAEATLSGRHGGAAETALTESQRAQGSSAEPTRSPSRTEPSPDLHELRWKSTDSPIDPQHQTVIKVSYSHIGTVGSEHDIRSRLRQTLSMSSVRIEPEDNQAGLTRAEVRLLVEVRLKSGCVSTCMQNGVV